MVSGRRRGATQARKRGSERETIEKMKVETGDGQASPSSIPSSKLPDLGSSDILLFTWEFNFNNFNLDFDLHSPNSINLLRSSVVDFERNRLEGNYSHWFGHLLVNFDIIGAGYHVNWVTFQGVYDFAYLIKILTAGNSLPESVETLFELVRAFFGDDWGDVKHILK
ncbi:hypothetical protein J5N97_024747 [Dioscorea zingiberensis]|uniref:Uncharacterized protein n=1 Tax=Dioscorea zingiberensis TaxID=325984 RepID=A0A9D5H985_9LILI|nr:hypothetical protein J5N97_024747 [Dioscorea zingiberensis]